MLRAIIVLCLGAAVGCSLTAPDIEDLVGGGPAAGATTGTGAAGGGATAGAGGAVCGDGVIDTVHGEECDPDGGRCVDCQVQCTPEEKKDLGTFHCYQLFPPPDGACGGPAECKDWNEAKASCGRERHLLVLTTPSEQAFLTAALSLDRAAFTAGKDPVDGDFVWDGFPETPFWRDNWARDQPDGGEAEGCLAVQPDFTFSDETCGGLQPYICEWEPPPP